ncbi:hypothetical protein A9Q81_26130 [Gammaproteobacteria bacterium 42_54_T18]|nr:hypothetical protein A9Q81_26130 [Gammaproteobacteria bacterium 42_54_T18]
MIFLLAKNTVTRTSQPSTPCAEAQPHSQKPNSRNTLTKSYESSDMAILQKEVRMKHPFFRFLSTVWAIKQRVLTLTSTFVLTTSKNLL